MCDRLVCAVSARFDLRFSVELYFLHNFLSKNSLKPKQLQQMGFQWICVIYIILLYVIYDITKVYQNPTLGEGQIYNTKMVLLHGEMHE